MKSIKFILLVCLLSIVSCEDVIEIDLDNADPRLVIDASLSWEKGTTGSNQFIKLTLTAPYFSETIPPATGASVTVTDSNNNTFIFIENDDSGVYMTNNFIPAINEVYNLTIEYENETYIATETLVPVVPIDYIEQKNDGGFSGEDIEIKAYYTDPVGDENFYLFEFVSQNRSSINLEVYDDEFSDGNQIFAFYSNDEIEPGDDLIIRNSGISKQTYQFTYILLEQTNGNSGDPFETTPATVRGNCVNTTNPEHFPFGYFRVTETDVVNYIVE
ncbi:DUF4249 family protein [Tamlana sp. I1]|uniref:DUF4249 family protein n=1 Tax=Tamlana sp. I1 TaxID=2762061 RepID=UPI0018904E9C|nr:DUF4249 family protein [Tamlana sp. I1]